MSSRLRRAGRLGAGLAVVGGGATALYLLTRRGKPKVGQHTGCFFILAPPP